ncbi:hypothetical protein C0J52_01474 [Blattella germanica]|nr:hypothetical protein C0J52_01474 [Blattella germanica]
MSSKICNKHYMIKNLYIVHYIGEFKCEYTWFISLVLAQWAPERLWNMPLLCTHLPKQGAKFLYDIVTKTILHDGSSRVTEESGRDQTPHIAQKNYMYVCALAKYRKTKSQPRNVLMKHNINKCTYFLSIFVKTTV